MQLKLRVFDPKEKKLQSFENDVRWNIEEEFEIPERMILQLIEEITDKLVESQFYLIDAMNRVRRQPMTYGEIEEVVRPTRAWKKIHIAISDLGFQTSRFTRISLFEQLLDIKKMKQVVNDKIREIEQNKIIKPIPQETIKEEIEPEKNIQKINPSILTDFIKKSNS
jgi:hypothetical protein